MAAAPARRAPAPARPAPKRARVAAAAAAPAPARPAAPKRAPAPKRPAAPKRAPARAPAKRARRRGPATARGAAILDTLLAGRGWIALVFVLLAGIVFFNVDLLRMNRDIAQTAERASAIKRENSRLRGEAAQLGSSERIQAVAAEAGLVMPAPGAVRYLRSRSGDAPHAARALAAGRAPTALPTDLAAIPSDPAAVPVEQAIDPATGLPIDPATGLPADPAATTAPAAAAPVEPTIDPATGATIDPATGAAIDPATGLPAE